MIEKKVGYVTYVLVWIDKEGFYGDLESGSGSFDTDNWHFAKAGDCVSGPRNGAVVHAQKGGEKA